MKVKFFLLSFTMIGATFQAIAQSDKTNQPNTSWQKSTGKEFLSASPLTLKPFDVYNFRYNPNALKAKENGQKNSLMPYSLEVKGIRKYLSPHQLLQGQMPCYAPKGNWSMPIYTPDTSIDYMLLIAKSQREF